MLLDILLFIAVVSFGTIVLGLSIIKLPAILQTHFMKYPADCKPGGIHIWVGKGLIFGGAGWMIYLNYENGGKIRSDCRLSPRETAAVVRHHLEHFGDLPITLTTKTPSDEGVRVYPDKLLESIRSYQPREP